MKFRLYPLILILMLPFSTFAQDCEFVSRLEAKEILSEMPAPVSGWADCHEGHPSLGIFMIARFRKIDDAGLKRFLYGYAKLTVYSGTSSRFLSYSVKLSGMREAVLETARINQMDPTRHFVFTAKLKDGATLVFIHSLGARETAEHRDELEFMRLILTGPKFLQAVAPLIDK